MTTLSALINERPAPQTLFQHLWATHWLLTLTGALSLALILGAALGLAVDARVITGAPAWAKPMKFAIRYLLSAARAASTNFSNSALISGWLWRFSGCHCTASAKGCAGSSMASITPSGACAAATTPGATFFTA